MQNVTTISVQLIVFEVKILCLKKRQNPIIFTLVTNSTSPTKKANKIGNAHQNSEKWSGRRKIEEESHKSKI
jgi:hypothetical protein